MKSKLCLVNSAYLENLLKRFRWVSFLISGIFLVNAILMYSGLGYHGGLSMLLMLPYFVLSYILIFTLPILLSNSNTSSNEASHMFSLPITRREYFFTTYVAGFILIGLPILFMYTVLFLIGSLEIVTFGRFLLMTLFLFFMYYHFSLLACQLTGSNLMKGVLIIAFSLLPIAIYGFFHIATTVFSISFHLENLFDSFRWMEFASPLVAGITYLNELQSSNAMFFNIMIGIGCLVVSYLIYSKKDVEDAEETISYSKVYTVLKYIFVVSCTLVLFTASSFAIQSITYSLQNRARYFILLIACITISLIIVEILFSKKIIFKQLLLRGVVLSIVLGGILIGRAYYMDYDLNHFKKAKYIYIDPSYRHGYGMELTKENTELNNLAVDFIKTILNDPSSIDVHSTNHNHYLSVVAEDNNGKRDSRVYYIQDDLYEKIKTHPFLYGLLNQEYEYLLELCETAKVIQGENILVTIDKIKDKLLEIDLEKTFQEISLIDNTYTGYTIIGNDEESFYLYNYRLLDYVCQQLSKEDNLYNLDAIIESMHHINQINSDGLGSVDGLKKYDFYAIPQEDSAILEHINVGYISDKFDIGNFYLHVKEINTEHYSFTYSWYLESDIPLVNDAIESEYIDRYDSYSAYVDVTMEFKRIDGEMKLIEFSIAKEGMIDA